MNGRVLFGHHVLAHQDNRSVRRGSDLLVLCRLMILMGGGESRVMNERGVKTRTVPHRAAMYKQRRTLDGLSTVDTILLTYAIRIN